MGAVPPVPGGVSARSTSSCFHLPRFAARPGNAAWPRHRSRCPARGTPKPPPAAPQRLGMGRAPREGAGGEQRRGLRAAGTKRQLPGGRAAVNIIAATYFPCQGSADRQHLRSLRGASGCGVAPGRPPGTAPLPLGTVFPPHTGSGQVGTLPTPPTQPWPHVPCRCAGSLPPRLVLRAGSPVSSAECHVSATSLLLGRPQPVPARPREPNPLGWPQKKRGANARVPGPHPRRALPQVSGV